MIYTFPTNKTREYFFFDPNATITTSFQSLTVHVGKLPFCTMRAGAVTTGGNITRLYYQDGRELDEIEDDEDLFDVLDAMIANPGPRTNNVAPKPIDVLT